MLKKTAIAFTLVSLFAASTGSVFAHHRDRVLGVETSTPTVPATVEGPGLILPDSPFFFLDEIKQQVRIIAAITPEGKAKVFAEVAGERLAELRFMLAKKNEKATERALEGVSDNLKQAAAQVSLAKIAGRNIDNLSKEINTTIKEKQKALDVLELTSQDELKSRVTAAQEEIVAAKVEVEDALPVDVLEKEIQETLERQAEREVHKTSEAIDELEDDINELEDEAEDAEKKSLARREKAIQEAIKAKNEQLKREKENLLAIEKRKQDELKKVNKQAYEQAKRSMESAREAAKKFSELQKEARRLRNDSVDDDNPTVSQESTSNNTSNSNSGPSENSGKSENSGSGSSNSGSGSSGSGKSGSSEDRD